VTEKSTTGSPDDREVRTVKRKPVVGDIVVTSNGKPWLVKNVVKDVWDRKIRFIAVVDLATGRYPNSFMPDEYQVVAAADAARLHASKED
jgi:signal peptidase I